MNNTAVAQTFTCRERERDREREREDPIKYLILDAQIVVLHNDLLSEFKQTLVLQSPLVGSRALENLSIHSFLPRFRALETCFTSSKKNTSLLPYKTADQWRPMACGNDLHTLTLAAKNSKNIISPISPWKEKP